MAGSMSAPSRLESLRSCLGLCALLCVCETVWTSSVCETCVATSSALLKIAPMRMALIEIWLADDVHVLTVIS